MPGISHVCLPCFFVQRLFFCLNFSQFSNSSILQSVVSSVSPLSDQLRPIVVVVVVVDILVFDVTVETISDAIETWTYQESYSSSFHAITLDMTRQDIELCFTCADALFRLAHLIWCDKILNFVSPVPLLFSRHKNWLRANSSGFSGNSRSRSSRWRSWGNCWWGGFYIWLMFKKKKYCLPV